MAEAEPYRFTIRTFSGGAAVEHTVYRWPPVQTPDGEDFACRVMVDGVTSAPKTIVGATPAQAIAEAERFAHLLLESREGA